LETSVMHAYDSLNEDGAAARGRVLLVDDEPTLRRLFRRTLLKAGHEVVEAANGTTAIALAQDGAFDAVVSDIRMPDMDGIELLRRLHELAPDLPVLLVSGSPDLIDRLDGLPYGAFEYLTKPLPLDDLRESVSRAVQAHQCATSSGANWNDYRSAERLRAAPRVGLFEKDEY
jgi:CheY-like chemotaxis protein